MTELNDTTDEASPEPETLAAVQDGGTRIQLHMPVNVRSVSLGVLALIASLWAMQWAKEVLIPILLGVMLSYALTPIVARLHRRGLPRAIAAGLLISGLVVLLAWGSWSLTDQANALVDTLPRVTQKVRDLTQRKPGTLGTIEKVQKAAQDLEAATVAAPASDASSPSAASSPALVPAGKGGRSRTATQAAQPGVTSAPAERPRIDVRAYVLSGTMGAFALLGQLSVVFLIALFLLASGNSFRRKMVKLAGPTFRQKKVTVETLDEIAEQIQRYLVVQLGVSVLVGVTTGLAFLAIGMEQAAVWAVVAGLTNLIPYLGAIIVSVGSAVTGLVQFGTVGMALLVGATSFAIHTLIGNLLTPWLMGRASRMSPVAVFVAVLLFGWLWGVWGLFLGVPVLMALKSICDRIEELRAVGELLGT